MDDDGKTMDILQQLEDGEIDSDQALKMIDGGAEDVPAAAQSTREERKWWAWWLVPFSLGMAAAAAGYGLSQLGGAWWICAGPLLVIGTLVMLVAVLTSQSPWVHVRVYTGQDSWPRRIAISLPLPLRLTAQLLRWFSPRIKGLDRTMVDELIIALEGNLTSEGPITIEVDEGESGERVEVFLG
ncbi:MAG: hypothetical protein PVF85_11845 [Anaerolineales bacterium]|jgi:hypothetical protein